MCIRSSTRIIDVYKRQVDADGVHVGQSDMKAHNVRQLIGENKILGVSVQSVEQALEAQGAGADLSLIHILH